jgi:hypothetical protein
MTTTNTPRVHSEKYPPKNRAPNPSLGHADMILVGKNVLLTVGPNELAMLSQTETLELGEPVGTSVLSGEPGFIYRDDEVTLTLTLAEMYRFLRFNLEPKEYFKLVELYGVFYAIKDRFYYEDSGIAVAPHWGPSDHKTFMFQCMNGTKDPEDIDDEVDKWHTDASVETSGILLRHFLGMREDEYVEWMKEPGSLYKILFVRMRDYGTE